MIPLGYARKVRWRGGSERPDSETFWASYSDLMAGLLMVFALTTVITLLDIGSRLVEPTQAVKEWEKVIGEIREDKDLAAITNVKIDRNTGALIFTDENLRFDFSKAELGERAAQVLREAVPKYMEIIHRHEKFLKQIDVIEISGHTDREDTKGANPYFSRVRAGEVLAFLMKEPLMAPYFDIIKKKAVAAGYSDTRYPPDCDGDRCPSARRVEIAVRLKDREMLREFVRILKSVIGGE